MGENTKKILLHGIELLQQTDKDIAALLAPRHDQIISHLNTYINEIKLFNDAYGLVAVKSDEELVVKHILDSLAPLGIISRLAAKAANNAACNAALHALPQIADAGSGAGLPGIPLAIALPQYHFTLIERMERRADFLWNAKAVLGLSNITIEKEELEKIRTGQFSLVTFRAFKPLEPKLLAALFNICTEQGIIAAYKGRHEKIMEEIAPLEKLCKWKALPCNVPLLNEERHLLVIEPQSSP